MPTITVKNLPQDLYDKLKLAAETSHRSINSEVIACIERSVSSQTSNPELLLVTARKLREATAGYYLTENELDQMIIAGRK